MLTRSMRADLGVMISASHNPYDDNGIKLFGPDGYKLSDESRERDRAAGRDQPVEARSPSRPTSAAPSASTACRTATSSSPSARCRSSSSSTACAWWSTAPTAPPIGSRPAALWELGAEVFSVGVEPDGFNINKECGSTAPDGARPQGARGARRHRHRARRRRRSRRHHRREGPPGRRRPAARRDRRELEGRGPPRQAGRGRDRDVQSRARAPPRAASASSWRARR